MRSPQMFIQSSDTLRIKITDTVFEMLITYKHKPLYKTRKVHLSDSW